MSASVNAPTIDVLTRTRSLPLGDTLCFWFFPRSLDASEALASPGVVDVITAQDVPGDNGREEESLYAQDEVV